MTIFGFGLHILIAIYFGIHAIRQGRELYWLMILFFFPLLGSIVYFFAIYLPEMRQSRGAQVAGRAIKQVMDPNRALREARQAFDLVPTAANRAALAAVLLETGSAAEALVHYRECASGPFANDPAFLNGLAAAAFANGDTTEAAATLLRLFASLPEARRQPASALLYARCQAAVGAVDALQAFEAALSCASGPEAKCRFADWLAGRDSQDQQRAAALYQEIVKESQHWHAHARAINKPWLQRAQAGLARG